MKSGEFIRVSFCDALVLGLSFLFGSGLIESDERGRQLPHVHWRSPDHARGELPIFGRTSFCFGFTNASHGEPPSVSELMNAARRKTPERMTGYEESSAFCQ